MGSTSLEAFRQHIDRVGLANRPVVFASYLNVWGDSLGEIGVPDHGDFDTNQACFAVLTPWAMIPTLAVATLVVDTLTDLRVVRLTASASGYHNPSWSVPYQFADDGSLYFGPADLAPAPPLVAVAVQAAKVARLHRTGWEDDFSFGEAAQIASELLNR